MCLDTFYYNSVWAYMENYSCKVLYHIPAVCVALNSKNISEVQINVKVSSPLTGKKTSAGDLI